MDEAGWFNSPVHPVFVHDGADKFLVPPIIPEDQCWIDFCGRVYIANILCGTIFEVEGFLYITSPSEKDVRSIGCVSLFHNEPARARTIGKTAFFQQVCTLCGFDIEILVADQHDSAFNRRHNLSPGSVRFVVPSKPVHPHTVRAW